MACYHNPKDPGHTRITRGIVYFVGSGDVCVSHEVLWLFWKPSVTHQYKVCFSRILNFGVWNALFETHVTFVCSNRNSRLLAQRWQLFQLLVYLMLERPVIRTLNTNSGGVSGECLRTGLDITLNDLDRDFHVPPPWDSWDSTVGSSICAQISDSIFRASSAVCFDRIHEQTEQEATSKWKRDEINWSADPMLHRHRCNELSPQHHLVSTRHDLGGINSGLSSPNSSVTSHPDLGQATPVLPALVFYLQKHMSVCLGS